VVCQIKFDPILQIDKEPPIDFQETIRSQFPILEIEEGVIIQFGISPSSENPAMGTAPKIYRYQSMDSTSDVALTQDFFALTTHASSHWKISWPATRSLNRLSKPNFRSHLLLALV
jgi:uncharacterized protein (TIGR04255 family)